MTAKFAVLAVENARYWTDSSARTPARMGLPMRVPSPSIRAVRRRRVVRAIEADPQIVKEVVA